MKDAFAEKTDKILRDMLDGKIYNPIEISGSGKDKHILQQLEALRKILVEVKDRECLTAEKTNTSLASVAHDLKTPLAVISGYAESIQDGMDDKDYADLILKKAAQMNELVVSLVDSSRNEIQKASEHRERVDAREFFRQETEKYLPLAASKKITLKISERVPAVFVRINKQEISRVIQNLITNAVKYTPEGGIVKVKFAFRSGNFSVSVKDNGAGISKDAQKSVFDKFYRADASRTDTASSGLGLYISKEIAEAHGGFIIFTSTEGKGSRFVLKLPVEDAKKRGLANGFDAMPRVAQFFIYVIFGMFLASVYRFSRFRVNYNPLTLIGAFLCIALFVFVWMPDIISILVCGRITFMAD